MYVILYTYYILYSQTLFLFSEFENWPGMLCFKTLSVLSIGVRAVVSHGKGENINEVTAIRMKNLINISVQKKEIETDSKRNQQTAIGSSTNWSLFLVMLKLWELLMFDQNIHTDLVLIRKNLLCHVPW